MQDFKEVQKRLLYLDSARGLAALSVMTWHFLVIFISRENVQVLKSPLHIFYYGESDIIFFFIHSGFILSYSYVYKLGLQTPISYIQFLLERIFRIYPLFILIIGLSYFSQKYFYNNENNFYLTEHAKSLWRQKSNLLDVLKQSLLIILPESQSNKRLLPQDWTLSVELIVGAILPFLIISIKKRTWLFAIVFIFFWKFCNTYTFEFGIGVLLFYFKEKIKSFWQFLNFSFKLSICFIAILFYSCLFQFGSLFSPENITFSYSLDRLFVNLGCMLFFMIIISSGRVQKILSNKWMVEVGRICYSLYLWHILWLILFASKVYTYIMHVSNSHFFSISFVFCLYILSVILLSILTFKFVELPFNKMGKRLAMCLIKLKYQFR